MRRDSRLSGVLHVLLHMAEQNGPVTSEVLARAMDTNPVVIRRARYQCSLTRQMFFPFDEVLDLPPGEISVSLGRRALRLATYMSFEPLQEEVLIQHGVRVSSSALNMLMDRVGSVAEQDRQFEIETLSSVPAGAHREARVALESEGPWPRRLYVSCDGITYRTRYRETDPARPKTRRCRNTWSPPPRILCATSTRAHRNSPPRSPEAASAGGRRTSSTSSRRSSNIRNGFTGSIRIRCSPAM